MWTITLLQFIISTSKPSERQRQTKNGNVCASNNIAQKWANNLFLVRPSICWPFHIPPWSNPCKEGNPFQRKNPHAFPTAPDGSCLSAVCRVCFKCAPPDSISKPWEECTWKWLKTKRGTRGNAEGWKMATGCTLEINSTFQILESAENVSIRGRRKKITTKQCSITTLFSNIASAWWFSYTSELTKWLFKSTIWSENCVRAENGKEVTVKSNTVLMCHDGCRLPHPCSLRIGTAQVPNHQPILHILTTKDPALGQKNRYSSSTHTLSPQTKKNTK